MESLIETFHIDVKLLIAQAINFAIVFVILYFLLLKPLLATMKNRTKTIEKSLNDAKKIEENLAKSKKEYNMELVRAKKEAAEILEKTEAQADKRRKEMIVRAKEEIGAIINQEKVKLEQEKARTLKEIKKEVADLVAATVEKILGKKVDAKQDEEIIKKLVK